MKRISSFRLITRATPRVMSVLALTLGVISIAGAAPKDTKVNWSPCYKNIGPTFECATVNVPMDYSKPNGAAIQLAVVRLPAGDPSAKIGSILLNPGGPGGSGVDFALGFGPIAGLIWGPQVAASFDIVGFDPRGIRRSTGVKCFGNERQAEQVFAPFAFPLTPEEEAIQAAGDALLADQCDQRGSKIGEHMSTANVARDMDRLREALGDDQINYVGLSYGSYLGNVYANMFPERVRALVIDGVLDPVAWLNEDGDIPFSTRLLSATGAQDTLDKLFQLCDMAAPGNCALAGDAAGRYAALADRLLDEPLVLGPDFVITYQDLIGFTLGALYNPFSYADFADVIAEVEALASPAAVAAALDRLERSSGLVNKRGFPNYVNFAEGFPAVACSDGNNPDDYAVWSEEGETADESSYFGRIWTWASSPCAQWPLRDFGRYEGDFTANTAHPVLVIGNFYDPATPYHGAVIADDLLQNSALLTVDVPGHTSLGLSLCAGFVTGLYLTNPNVIAPFVGTPGIFCGPEYNPFDFVAESTSSAEDAGVEFPARQMSEIAFVPFR